MKKKEITFTIPPDIQQLRNRAKALRERADQLADEAWDSMTEYVKRILRENEDKLLNRKQCLQYLPIDSYESLKNWEKKFGPYGYLRF